MGSSPFGVTSPSQAPQRRSAPQLRIHAADGTEARVIDATPLAALAEFRVQAPELLQVPTRDGFLMEAMLDRYRRSLGQLRLHAPAERPEQGGDEAETNEGA